MKIDEDEKNKIIATKPPLLTMKVLRPLAHFLAEYTDPSQVSSIAKQFGFDKNAKTQDEGGKVILEIFETLQEENNNKDIIKIIEILLTLYAQLIDEGLHEDGLIGFARKILYTGHYQLAFHIHKKEYILVPFEGTVHGIVMRAEGTNESDFQEIKKHKMRNSQTNELFVFTLTKDGTLSRRDKIKGDKSYKMEKGSMRHKVFTELSSASLKNEEYYPTKELAEFLNFTPSQIMRTCGEIRKQILKHFLGIKNKEVIDSIRKTGYRINPKTRIIQSS